MRSTGWILAASLMLGFGAAGWTIATYDHRAEDRRRTFGIGLHEDGVREAWIADDHERALKRARAWSKEEPTNDQAVYWLAHALERNDEHELAAHAWHTLLRSTDRRLAATPGDPRVWYHRGCALAGLGEVADSRIAMDRAMRVLGPGGLGNNPVGRYNAACYYAVSGRTREANEALSNAVMVGWPRVPEDLAWMLADPDLESIRSTPRYRRLVESLAP